MARRPFSGSMESAEDDSFSGDFRQIDPRIQLLIVALLALAAVAFVIAYRQARQPQPTPAAGSASPPLSPQMLLGNPSGATDDPANADNYLMLKPYFALSYNSDHGTPNWVSWRVDEADLGKAPRKQEFDPDTLLPPGFNVITFHDYTGGGFDRGHMCPHSDRSANTDMSFATFVMSNVIPQAPNVNRKAWEQLEHYGRELVLRHHDRLYITSGPAGQGGRGSRGFADTIGHGRVVVPASCWKIIVAIPEDGDDDLAKINTDTRVIAVIMPNDQEKVGEAWDGFRTSPADIETRTGFHFFDRVPTATAQYLRSKVDHEEIPIFHSGYVGAGHP